MRKTISNTADIFRKFLVFIVIVLVAVPTLANKESAIKAHIIEDEVISAINLDAAADDASTVSQPPAKATGFQSAPPFSIDSLVSVVSSLLIVIVCIFVFAFLYKRYAPTNFQPAAGMRVTESMALSARERLIIVDVSGRRFLLASGSNGTNMIAELDSVNDAPIAPTEKKFSADEAAKQSNGNLSARAYTKEEGSLWNSLVSKFGFKNFDLQSEDRSSRKYTDREKLRHYALDALSAEHS